MKQSGRVHPLILLALLGVILVVGLLFVGGEDVSATGAKFLSSLAKGDAKALAELSYLDGRDPATVEKEWAEAVDQARYYRFRWKVIAASQTNDKSAAIRIQIFRNSDSPGTFEENFGLPMVKENGKWKVQVSGLNREMYPFLPK